MMIKLKDFRETISAPPFCNHAGSRLLPNALNIPNCGQVLKLAKYRVPHALEASLIYTHIPNLKGLTKIFFKLSRPKGNLCGGGSVTVLNPKYPRLSSGDTIISMSSRMDIINKISCNFKLLFLTFRFLW